MSDEPEVVVVGHLMTDVVARVETPIAVGSDTPARVAAYGGGSAANTAAWFAAAGARATLVARRGADPLGMAAEEQLRAVGVRPCLAIDAGLPTGTCVVVVDATGERTMLPDLGANLGLSVGDLPATLFAAGRHLHLSGYLLFDAATRPAAGAALRLARSAGMSVSVDPSSAAPLRALGAARFLAETAGADYCLPNLDEAEVLAGTRSPAAAGAALAARYGEVVVKLGADGALWSDGAQVVAVPAVPTHVVDTTGAGDAFAAGFLTARLRGEPPRDALTAGAALAARAISAVGGRPAQPSP